MKSYISIAIAHAKLQLRKIKFKKGYMEKQKTQWPTGFPPNWNGALEDWPTPPKLKLAVRPPAD